MRLYYVRDKADKRPIKLQIDELCEKLSKRVTFVSYDKNYLIVGL